MNLLNRFRLLRVISSRYPVLHSIRNNSPILSTMSVNFVGKHLYSNESNNNSSEWIQSLDEKTKSKIQYIQNEVHFAIKLNQRHKNNFHKFFKQLTLLVLQHENVPKPEWISRDEYIEMLEMKTPRRRSYYSYLHGKCQRRHRDEV